MLDGFRWRRTRSGGPRRRLGGCLLWILGLIVALIILSLLFGGFQKGTKASLAGAYHIAGKMPLAVQLSEQACADSERALGADHTDTLTRRAALANLYYAAGRLGDAQTLLRDTVARCERILPHGDPLTQTVHQSLASITGEA